MKISLVLITLLAFVILASIFLVVPKERLPQQAFQQKPSQEPPMQQQTALSDTFAHTQELHWTHMPLGYAIFNCSAYEARRIMDAFARLENETQRAVSFVASTSIVENTSGEYFLQNTIDVNIEVTCHVEYGKILVEGYITAGDSGYFVYSANPQTIVRAKVNFYGISSTTYTGGCPIYPDIEMHEILHAFGFQHVVQYNHIMNPTHSYCPSKVNDDVLEKLKRVYGQEK